MPAVRTFADFIARATARMVASPRQSSPMPGAVSRTPVAGVLSRFTWTSVPSGNTVSRWADRTTVGPVPVPGRSPITLPVASMRRLVMPSVSSRRRNSAARAASLNGGDAISQIEVCCSRVQALSAFSVASAARIAVLDDGIAIGCACSAAGINSRAEIFLNMADAKFEWNASPTYRGADRRGGGLAGKI